MLKAVDKLIEITDIQLERKLVLRQAISKNDKCQRSPRPFG